jgi:signal transduction histidine kinase/putative methionine-R-sulfoxide reductase with GAF domain/HAMP domain-containing protein
MTATTAAPPAAVTAAEPAEARRVRMGLSVKFALAFVGLVSLLLIAGGAINMWLSYDEAKRAAVRVQQEKAQAAAERIDRFVAEIEQQIGWTIHAQWSAGSLDQRRYDFVRLLRQVPAITELVEIDGKGKEQLKVSRLAMDVVASGTDYSSDPRFAKAVADKVWFSPVYFRKESEPYMTIAAAHVGRNPGVTVAEVNLKFIWDVVSAIKIGTAGYAYVVNGHGRLIAHPDISLVLRDSDLSRLSQVADALAARQRGEAPVSSIAAAGGPEGGSVLSAYAAIPRLDWLVFVELPLGEAMAPVYASLLQTGALLTVGLLLAAIAGTLLARRMTVPIRRLQAGAERLGSGALGHRIEIRTGDEIEVLADRFNRMAGQLQDSYETLESKVETRTRDLAQALEYQTATSEVLRIVASSPDDLQPVFEAMLGKATELCEAEYGFLALYDGEAYAMVAGRNLPQALADALRSGPHRPGPNAALRRLARTKAPVHIEDVRNDIAYVERDPWRVAAVESGGARAQLAVPLLKKGELIGAFIVYRLEPRPFADSQIALVTTFADQAVIAIENARLLGELRQRSAELARSVEELTATSDVLKIISRSTVDLETVLDTLVETAARLCDADQAYMFRPRGDRYHMVASWGLSKGLSEFILSHPFVPGRGTVTARAALERRTIHITDVLQDPDYTYLEGQRIGGFRTILAVPLLREDTLVGIFSLNRTRVDPYTDKQIELVSTFADQAVIAIENARLFEELRERSGELARSVDELTATSDVLKIISRSTVDLETVLDTLVETAGRLCRAEQTFMFRRRDDRYHLVASRGAPDEFLEWVSRNPFEAGRGTTTGRAVSEGRIVHIADVLADPEYVFKEGQGLAGYRTNVAVPLMRGGTLIGVFTLCRTRVDPFTEKEIELLTTFADQAVIAIENARLFDELRERSAELARSVEELRALSVVGQAVTSSLELKLVLETIVARATELAGADGGAIFRYGRRRRQFRLWHAAGFDAALLERLRDFAVSEDQTELGRAARENRPIELTELAAMPSAPLRDILLAAGFHSALIVPLVRGERVFGALVMQRRAPGKFGGSTVDILQTFASQSVLAIQNARLFREIEDKSHQLQVASQHKSQFLANMSHELRTPLNAVLGYAELLLDGIYGELSDKARGVLERVQSNGKHLLGLINDVLDLSKIEAGQLTLAIEDYALPAVVHSVVSATESLAKAKGLSLSFSAPRDLPMGRGDERRLTQVLLNLVGNAIKFTDKGSVGIEVAVSKGCFELAVSDTGPGIAKADQARIFEEFQQVDSSSTRQKGGTGLGLAISKRIVEMHGGGITVDSEPGKGSTFHVVIPVRVEQAKEVA